MIESVKNVLLLITKSSLGLMKIFLQVSYMWRVTIISRGLLMMS